MSDNEKNECAYSVLPIERAETGHGAAQDAAAITPQIDRGRASDSHRFTSDAPGPLRRIDGRTKIGGAYRRVKLELVTALGGQDEVTPQDAMVIRRAAEADAICRAIFSAVAKGALADLGQYNATATTALRALKLLGLKRRAREVGLGDILRGARSE